MTAPDEHGVNVPLLRDVLTYITEHPEEWDQGQWVPDEPDCGTACCLAGRTALMTGWSLTLSPLGAYYMVEVRKGDREEHPADVARDALRLDYDDSKQLFSDWNTLDDLWRIAGDLTNGEIQRPAVTS